MNNDKRAELLMEQRHFSTHFVSLEGAQSAFYLCPDHSGTARP